MRLTVWVTALLATTPVLAQNKSPFQGAMPNTFILDAGWQMTPEEDRCVLTHRGETVGQDLVVLAARHKEDVVLGLILPAKGAYTAPVQLTVVSQATEATQIGRVTFNPTTGALGTLLMANWPANRLLPRMTQAIRFNFYTSDGHLVRSVKMAGSVAAMESLNRCRGIDGTTPMASDDEAHSHAIDVGWMPQFDREGCGIRRITRNGNEFGFRYTRRQGMMSVYQLHSGPSYNQDEVVPIRFEFWQSDGDKAPTMLTNATILLSMHSTNVGNGPVLFSVRSDPLVNKLRLPGLNALSITSTPAPVGRIDDVVNLSGSNSAADGMAQCIRVLPR